MIILLFERKINVDDKLKFLLFVLVAQQENPVFSKIMLGVSKTFLLLLLLVFERSYCGSEEDDLLASNLRPVRNDTVQGEAALSLIKRLLPLAYAKLFSVEISASSKDWAVLNTYQKVHNTTYVNIEASSGVMATYVFHEYLKQFCGCQVSWEHQQLSLPTQLPEAKNFSIVPVDLVRFYQNPCLYGYTFAFWSWSDWSRHIDWMALNGLNLVLASSGQELIWLKTYEKLGLKSKLMRDYFTGKIFLPWNRMGNLKAWTGPLSFEVMQNDARLQKRILQRMLALGITPAVPAFNGIVPTEMTHFFPNETFFPLRRWGNRPFPRAFSGLYYLLPNSTLFRNIQLTFKDTYIETYGKVSHFYAFDTFNEMSPHSGDLAFLASYGQSISASLTEMDPKAIWLMQGWMFKNATFWRPSRAKALLQAVEREHILILDLASTTNPQFSRLQGYYNRSFVYCMLHNYGGVSGLYGKIHEVSRAPYEAREQYSNCVGMGLTPEGLHNSYVMYDLMMETFKRRSSIKDISQWLLTFSHRRYGEKDINLEKAWHFLGRSVFDCCDRLNTTGKKPFRFHGKTTLTVLPRVSQHSIGHNRWYEFEILLKAWHHIYSSNSLVSIKDYDLVEVTREVLENLLDQRYKDAMKALYKNESVAFTNHTTAFMNIIEDLEDLLASNSHFMLGPWLEKAKSAAASANDTENEFMARNLITLWGPEGNILDYARRTWSGLVRDYYGRRWSLFFQMLGDSFRGKKFKQKTYNKKFMRRIGLPFQSSSQLYPTSPTTNTAKVVTKIYKKWIQPLLNGDE